MTQAVTNKIHIDYNKLIGKIGYEYYYLRYVFDDDGMRGATGSILRAVTMDEAQERRDNWDEDNELWKQAVSNDETTLGADDWHDQSDGYLDECVFDLPNEILSDDLMDILANEYQAVKRNFDIELIESTGGGRCFKPNMQWDKLYNNNLWALIKQYES